jgi:DNA/RNA endonuclease G (NUC1)
MMITIFFLSVDSRPSATIFCLSGDSFNVNNERRSISEFNECSSQISGNAINLNRRCAENGSFINIGFQLSEGKGFVNLIDVCYDKKKGSSIYTRHILHGKSIKNAMKSSLRPSTFKTVEVPSNIEASKSFTKANQLKRFEDIFNDRVKAQEFLNKTYLARGHLAPDGDFLFVSWQFATYYYINTVPQWQSINNANWKYVEGSLRAKAHKLKEDCVIFTGGFEVLKLNNRKISLEPDGLEVPKWTWKVVKVLSSNSGIAFVTYNNPFVSSAPVNLCQDICKDFGWDWKDRKTFTKGYTICCSVLDLMNAILTVPAEAQVERILEK